MQGEKATKDVYIMVITHLAHAQHQAMVGGDGFAASVLDEVSNPVDPPAFAVPTHSLPS